MVVYIERLVIQEVLVFITHEISPLNFLSTKFNSISSTVNSHLLISLETKVLFFFISIFPSLKRLF